MTKITLRETATPANVRQSFEYGYDQVGNRVWVKYANGTGDVYQYDATYQVTGVQYGVSNPTTGYVSGTGASHAVTYAYDAVGNRSQMVIAGTGTTSYTVNNLNQYSGTSASFSYDTNGNMTGNGSWTYGYDREDHLVSATISGTSVIYKYDALGRRAEKNVNGTVTKYVYSDQNLIEERDGSNGVTAKYIYAGGIDNPVKVIKGANVYYYQQDALGNVTALIDASGDIYESYTYDIFGSPTIKDGGGNVLATAAQSFLFTGREYDPETGLYHYRTRAYSPELGRFLQPDTISFSGGDVNLYRYVGNNPINFTDPLGLVAFGHSPTGPPGGPEECCPPGTSYKLDLDCYSDCIDEYQAPIGRNLGNAAGGAAAHVGNAIGNAAAGPTGRTGVGGSKSHATSWQHKAGSKLGPTASKIGRAAGRGAVAATIFDGFFNIGLFIGCAIKCTGCYP